MIICKERILKYVLYNIYWSGYVCCHLGVTMNVYIDGRKFSNTGSKMKNKPKKKVSISISEANFDKIENITKDNP